MSDKELYCPDCGWPVAHHVCGDSWWCMNCDRFFGWSEYSLLKKERADIDNVYTPDEYEWLHFWLEHVYGNDGNPDDVIWYDIETCELMRVDVYHADWPLDEPERYMFVQPSTVRAAKPQMERALAKARGEGDA